MRSLRRASRQPRIVEAPAGASANLAYVMGVYNGSDGDATMAMYRRLECMGPTGRLAVDVFRAQKASERAKAYRGGNGGGSYRAQAYEKKQWSMNNLATSLNVNADFGLRWGWAIDPGQTVHAAILYVDLPTGQVSWHTETRGVGPDYPGVWDQVQGAAASRICRWVADLLDAEL